MKKSSFLWIALAVVALVLGSCGQQKSQAYYDYSSKVIQSHADGSYVIRAWGRSRNAAMSYDVAQKQALQDVIFKGVQAQSGNIGDLKPLCYDLNAREKYEDYFNAFFADNGDWKKYVSMKDRRIMTSNYSRTDAQVLAQVTVTVFRADLKARLQNDGIIPAGSR